MPALFLDLDAERSLAKGRNISSDTENVIHIVYIKKRSARAPAERSIGFSSRVLAVMPIREFKSFLCLLVGY